MKNKATKKVLNKVKTYVKTEPNPPRLEPKSIKLGTVMSMTARKTNKKGHTPSYILVCSKVTEKEAIFTGKIPELRGLKVTLNRKLTLDKKPIFNGLHRNHQYKYEVAV